MDRTAQLIARPAEYAVAYDPAGPPGPPQLGAPAPGTPHLAALRRRAASVLAGNWTGTSTVPSPGLYPHQWSWDSAFIAIGLRHVSPRRAQTELETLSLPVTVRVLPFFTGSGVASAVSWAWRCTLTV
ncbi:hypothetical protein AB0L81_29490, partial [Streptomyces sp. NPDC052127]